MVHFELNPVFALTIDQICAACSHVRVRPLFIGCNMAPISIPYWPLAVHGDGCQPIPLRTIVSHSGIALQEIFKSLLLPAYSQQQTFEISDQIYSQICYKGHLATVATCHQLLQSITKRQITTPSFIVVPC